jgi:hypothetical protein
LTLLPVLFVFGLAHRRRIDVRRAAPRPAGRVRRLACRPRAALAAPRRLERPLVRHVSGARMVRPLEAATDGAQLRRWRLPRGRVLPDRAPLAPSGPAHARDHRWRRMGALPRRHAAHAARC